MNYLAHLVLSGGDPEIRMGNLMGDFTTGRLEHERFQHLPVNIRLGLALHRWIDQKTDEDPRIGFLLEKHRPAFGKWTPIVLDVLGDFFLVNHWARWGLGDWETYEAQIYTDLQTQAQWAPPSMKPMLDSLLAHRWLSGYGTVEGILRSVQSVERRAKQPIPWSSIPALLEDTQSGLSEVYAEIFLDFLPQTNDFIHSHRES